MVADEILAGETPSAGKLSRRAIKVVAKVTADQTGIGAGPTDLTSFTTGSFTALANRHYRLSVKLAWLINTATAGYDIFCYLDGVAAGSMCRIEGGAGQRGQATGWVMSTPSAGSRTWKAVATRYGGTGTLDISNASGLDGYFTLEDCGPV